MARIARRPRVEDDLHEIWLYIARDSVGAADRFFAAVEDTFDLLLAAPHMGAPHLSELSRFSDVRFVPVRRFHNYLVYYRPTDEGILILRVLRGNRDRDRILGTEP